MDEAGQKLKRVRERLGLRFRDVEEASARIAARRNNDEFIVALSRLADIENKGRSPPFIGSTLCARSIDWIWMTSSPGTGSRPRCCRETPRFRSRHVLI